MSELLLGLFAAATTAVVVASWWTEPWPVAALASVLWLYVGLTLGKFLLGGKP